MALQVSYKSIYGVTALKSYAKIADFRGNKNIVEVGLQFYYDEAAANSAESHPLGYATIPLNIQYGATMEQMYAALKELDEFKDAKDV